MIHEEATFRAGDNLRLYYQSWRPQTAGGAVVVIVHGLFEHSGRYRALGERLAGLGYGVYAPDLRGHGLSQGKHVWARSFADYTDDLEILLRSAGQEFPGAAIFMLGHCMGALIAMRYALKHPSELSGLITSGALLRPGRSLTALSIAQTYMLGSLPLLSSSVGVALFNERGISRSQRVIKDYLEDPLVAHGNVSARLGLIVLKQTRSLTGSLRKIKLPLLVMHGAADPVSDVEGSRLVYRKSGSADKTLKLYDGLYHDIFNDPGHEQILADLEAWLAGRAGLPAAAPNQGDNRPASADMQP